MLQPEPKTELIVNGRKAQTAARTIAELLEEQELAEARVATALNGHFVPAPRRATTPLNAGDRVEIVSARQGG
jgi:sulfur carrier protein